MIQLTSKPNVKTLPSLLGVVILSALYCIFILKTGDRYVETVTAYSE